MDGCVIENNTGIENGIYNANGSLLLKNLIYSGNSHTSVILADSGYLGTCISLHNKPQGKGVIVENATISNNKGDRTLACIWGFSTNISIRNVQISNNSAPNEVQGILFSDFINSENQVCQFTVENLSVENNNSTNVSAVTTRTFAEDKKSVFNLSLSNCKSLFNEGTGFAYDLTSCTNSLLMNCLSQAEYGGVKTGEGKVTISDCQFIYNTEPVIKGPNTTENNNLIVQ